MIQAEGVVLSDDLTQIANRSPSGAADWGHQHNQATFCGRPCTSRFKGVFSEKRREHWVASIKKDRVQLRLGSFHDEIAAAQAYHEAAREMFGEHARVNSPDGVYAWLAVQAGLGNAAARAA